ncbi:MAG: LytTR family DNA-binding domain-containing protein [Eggerthellaceae bacterium]|nr:LytTR family DNA-binding domain-containing protein [Eggerthellaceae bacterium]
MSEQKIGVNIAICDDNAKDAQEIRGYLLSYFERNGFVGAIHLYDNAEALLDDFAPGRFDVLFLDIFLKGMSGVDAAAIMRKSDPNCLIVFITMSDSFMREGFALRAASYVEKPLTPEKMEVALTQCHDLFLKNARYIEITLTQRGFKVPLARLAYAEVAGKSILFHTDMGESFEARMSMDEAEKQLEGAPFLRCHNSFVVNMNYVEDIQGNNLVLKSGQVVPIRKNGRREVVDTLNEFMTERLFEGR